MITFEGTVDSAPAEHMDLELAAEWGTVEFRANVGVDWALNHFVVNTAGSVVVGSDATPVTVFKADGGIDLGGEAVIDGGIYLDAGAGGLLAISTAGGAVRLNGAVELQSDVRIDSSDDGAPQGAEIRFTLNTPIDSRAGEHHDLILTAGTDGVVSFNADVGSYEALGQLLVTDAQGVVFGGDWALGDDLAPVTAVWADGDPLNADAFVIDIGSATAIGADGIALNAGDGNTLAFITTADRVRFNGAVELQSDVLIDTSNAGDTGGAEIRFTIHAPLDSQAGEHNDLTLTAGTDGMVNFNGDIGSTETPGQLVVTDAKGVAFGNDASDINPDLAPLTSVRLDGDAADPAAWGLDVGSITPIGEGGILLNAGHTLSDEQLTLSLVTTSDAVRLNGAVELRSHAVIDTSDGQATTEAGADIRFTDDTPIDSQLGEYNDLTLTAGTGQVEFNANIGAYEALNRLEITLADGGVVWGASDQTEGPEGDRGPVQVVSANGGIDVGSDAVITSGIVLNAGRVDDVEQQLELNTAGTDVRLNGPVTLASHVAINTGEADGGDIVFTDESQADSEPGESNDLVLTAGWGGVEFNADIGAQEPLHWLEVTRADGGVVFGGADSAEGELGDRGPVQQVTVAAGLDLGSQAVLNGGIVHNAGPGQEQAVRVTANNARWNGPVWLNSPVLVDTATGNGDITFTHDAPIDSQLAEQNSLRLQAGDGGVYWNANVGAGSGGDHTLGRLTVETSGTIATAADKLWASGDVDFQSSGDVVIGEVPPGRSELVGQTVTITAGGLLTIENEASVAGFANGGGVADPVGRVSNIPPLLRLDIPPPSRALGLFDRVQIITGTFGGDEAQGDHLELGSNFTLTVVWDDQLPANVIPHIHAGDRVELHVDEAGHGVPVITHVQDTGPVEVLLTRQYPIPHLFTVTNFVYATVTVLDDSAIRLDDLRPIDLNTVADISATRVSSAETRYAEMPKEFVPPAPLRESEEVTFLAETVTTPLETVRSFESVRARTETAAGTVRIVYLVRVLPNGRESDLLLLADDALNDVTELFEKFKEQGLPNGRYRIYLKETGLPPRRVIEFYKSGQAFGDPLHEPGPGSNPMPRGAPALPPQRDGDATPPAPQRSQTRERPDGGPLVMMPQAWQPGQTEEPWPAAVPDSLDERTRPGREVCLDEGGEELKAREDWAALGDMPHRLVPPLIGMLAASLEAVVPDRGRADWRQRVDEALEKATQDALGRWMRRRRRFSDSTDRRFRS
jgi:hypothetical protein